MVVRPWQQSDADDIDDVCVRTGASGGDATGLYPADLLPDVFARPYLALEPELAFVVDDGSRAVGYVLGTSDTARWVAEHRERWLPLAGARHPLVEPPVDARDRIVHLLHHPELNLRPETAGYPAHLHIDLLPQAQGKGLGRVLIRTFLAAVRAQGVSSVHLGMSPANTGARAFYDRLGFHELHRDPGVVLLGISTDHPV